MGCCNLPSPAPRGGSSDRAAEVLGVREGEVVERLAGAKVLAALHAERVPPQLSDVAVVEHHSVLRLVQDLAHLLTTKIKIKVERWQDSRLCCIKRFKIHVWLGWNQVQEKFLPLYLAWRSPI